MRGIQALSTTDLNTKLRTFREKRGEWGLRRTLFWYAMHLVDNRYLGMHLAYVLVGSDRRAPQEMEQIETPPGYVHRANVPKELLLPFVGVEHDLEQAKLDRAYDNGDTCVATFHGEQLVGYGFSSRTRAVVTKQIDLLVPRGFVYGYKGWTHPQHRRMRLTRSRELYRQMNNQHPYLERSLFYIAVHNYASLMRGYRHPRERPIRMGFAGYFSLFGRQYPFNSRRARWIGFRFARRDDEKKINHLLDR